MSFINQSTTDYEANCHSDYVTLDRKRYDELIANETKLRAVCDVMLVDRPYAFDIYQAIVGEQFLPIENKKGDRDEDK